jgi:concanavalin A-like lectin/glucanase superfamily protein/type IX secretion system substrate protein
LVSPQVLDANMVLTPGVYHHIAITYSKASSTLTMFIDGVNVNSGTVNIDADSIYYGSDAHDSSVNYIGLSSFVGDPPDPQFNGNIDEFRISDTVRYTSDFTPSSVPFTTDSHTIVLHHFDDGSGQMAADSSGNEYTGELGTTVDEDTNDPLWVSCGNVLASSFLSFNATAEKEHVQLSWNAAANVNTRYYEIQRSTDAVHFNTLNKTVQTGTNGNYNYSYTDLSPAHGNNYYRLKQVDINGSYTYSKIVAVNMNGNGTFKVYPTIAASTLHVSVTQTPSTVIIFNLNGKAVKTLTLNNNEQDINVSTLPVGNYIIRNITTNSSLKFVKQ